MRTHLNGSHWRHVLAGALVTAALTTAVATTAAAAENAGDIVARSVAVTQQDWSNAPHYSFIDREVSAKRGHAQPTKTERVLMIEGSPYNQLTALNDAPLSKEQQEAEARKLAVETAKRQHESVKDRKHRIQGYLRERMQDHQMLAEMANAFQYTLAGEDMLEGHKVWVIKATVKKGYRPRDHEGKVLMNMQGELWIDESTHQWVKVQAEVMKPVSIYGFLAKVKPGTRFELEQMPVSPDVWMPKRFVVVVKAEALGIRNEDSLDQDDFHDYQLQAQNGALQNGSSGHPSER